MQTTYESDLSRLDADDLEEELATLAAHLSAGTCRWLEIVGELDRRSRWAISGHQSCAAWIAWRCSITPRAAREHVRVARCLPKLPQTHAAFTQGALSYAKVRALTRVATADNENELLELAATCTAAQLERVVRACRRVTTAEARDQLEWAYLNVFWATDGSLELHGRLAPEDGALVLRALEAMRDDLFREDGGSAEPPAARQASNAEALVAAADTVLAVRAERALTNDERYQVVVHVDQAVLDHDGDGGCALEDGSALAPETARRLACDASIVRDGRKSRAVPPTLRRALRARDRRCRFPGCENRRFVDAHHIRHWSQGGATTIDNLVLLCRCHHRLVHEGGYRVDRKGRFFYPWGMQVAPVPRLPRGDPAELARRHDGREIGAGTIETGAGDRLDLALAVDALLAARVST